MRTKIAIRDAALKAALLACLLFTGCRSFIAGQALETAKVNVKPVDGLTASNHYQQDFLFLKAAGQQYAAFEDRYFPPEKRAAMEREIMHELGQPDCTWQRFVLDVRRYLAVFNSEHACIQFNPHPLDFTNRYPFKVHYFSNDLYLSDIAVPYDRSIIGQKITAIDGLPVSDVEGKLFDLVGAENICVRRASLAPFGYSQPETYWLVGLSSSPTNEVKLEFANHSSVLVAPVGKSKSKWQAPQEFANPLTARQRHPFDCRIFPERGFAYLQFNECFDRTAILDGMQMVNLWFRPLVYTWVQFELHREHPSPVLAQFYDPERPVLKDYMESSIREINQKGITNLIIDLRYNGGGEMNLLPQFLYFLTARTNLVAASAIDSDEIRDLRTAYIKKCGVEPTPEQLLQARHEEPSFFETVTNRSSLYYVPPQRTVFKGRIVVLADQGTGSAAAHLAAMIQDNRLATVVGTSTGNNPTGPTEMLPIKLPHSGILVSMPDEYVQRAVPANGDIFQPDYWAENSFADTKAGRDAAFEKALELLELGPDLSPQQIKAVIEYLSALKKAGRLPDWSKDEEGALAVENYRETITLRSWKPHDPSIVYHYEIAQTSKDGDWKLLKAWRSNRKNRVLEVYKIP